MGEFKKRIKNTIKNKKGYTLLGFILISTFITYFILYLIFGASYFMKRNDMENVAYKKLDRALVQGQFDNSLQQELVDELESQGFNSSDLEIIITPTYAGDSYDSTYVSRGDEIELKVIYKKPHKFYLLNMAVPESKFWIGEKASGMSEKW
ncbi:hypothetical protein [Senegalia massiliensis]|uniref:Uncharacterized protein n=1 Tax=Senegalia massiliensis TaxID=1720316 RepID=A0A845R501_9CLOT|nr:hypothetical protein [Senegalia massiliensis]NBI07583.1 hypothetical protein [Senegalia massiliensis]